MNAAVYHIGHEAEITIDSTALDSADGILPIDMTLYEENSAIQLPFTFDAKDPLDVEFFTVKNEKGDAVLMRMKNGLGVLFHSIKRSKLDPLFQIRSLSDSYISMRDLEDIIDGSHEYYNLGMAHLARSSLSQIMNDHVHIYETISKKHQNVNIPLVDGKITYVTVPNEVVMLDSKIVDSKDPNYLKDLEISIYRPDGTKQKLSFAGYVQKNSNAIGSLIVTSLDGKKVARYINPNERYHLNQTSATSLSRVRRSAEDVPLNDDGTNQVFPDYSLYKEANGFYKSDDFMLQEIKFNNILPEISDSNQVQQGSISPEMADDINNQITTKGEYFFINNIASALLCAGTGAGIAFLVAKLKQLKLQQYEKAATDIEISPVNKSNEASYKDENTAFTSREGENFTAEEDRNESNPSQINKKRIAAISALSGLAGFAISAILQIYKKKQNGTLEEKDIKQATEILQKLMDQQEYMQVSSSASRIVPFPSNWLNINIFEPNKIIKELWPENNRKELGIPSETWADEFSKYNSSKAEKEEVFFDVKEDVFFDAEEGEVLLVNSNSQIDLNAEAKEIFFDAEEISPTIPNLNSGSVYSSGKNVYTGGLNYLNDIKTDTQVILSPQNVTSGSSLNFSQSQVLERNSDVGFESFILPVTENVIDVKQGDLRTTMKSGNKEVIFSKLPNDQIELLTKNDGDGVRARINNINPDNKINEIFFLPEQNAIAKYGSNQASDNLNLALNDLNHHIQIAPSSVRVLESTPNWGGCEIETLAPVSAENTPTLGACLTAEQTLKDEYPIELNAPCKAMVDSVMGYMVKKMIYGGDSDAIKTVVSLVYSSISRLASGRITDLSSLINDSIYATNAIANHVLNPKETENKEEKEARAAQLKWFNRFATSIAYGAAIGSTIYYKGLKGIPDTTMQLMICNMVTQLMDIGYESLPNIREKVIDCAYEAAKYAGIPAAAHEFVNLIERNIPGLEPVITDFRRTSISDLGNELVNATKDCYIAFSSMFTENEEVESNQENESYRSKFYSKPKKNLEPILE